MGRSTTQERLRQLFEYNEVTGVFKRRVKTAPCNKAGDIAGHISKCDGYHAISIDGLQIRSHRLAWIYCNGDIPTNMQIDHIDGVRCNNALANLRLVTNQGNSLNASLSKNNSTGITGVIICKQTGRWKAQIYFNGKCYNLGRYIEKIDAVIARRKAENRFGFHHNHGKANA